MASTLSASAIYRITFLVENDDRRTCENAGLRTIPGYCYEHDLQRVNSKWKTIYKLYAYVKPAPPRDYIDSVELALVLKGQVDDADVRTIFAHHKPLEFWGCPRLLVSKIVEVRRPLQ